MAWCGGWDGATREEEFCVGMMAGLCSQSCMVNTQGLTTGVDWERRASTETLQVLGLMDGERGMATGWGHGVELC